MSAPVDLTSLREITAGDAALERELFAAFLESADACLAGLKAGCETGRDDAWRKQAHALKGTCLNLGAMELGQLCKNAQENFQQPADKKRDMLIAIESEFARVKEFLEKAAA
jgi:HPt (histidine-containing phosphotransfer) domain-containing protein